MPEFSCFFRFFPEFDGALISRAQFTKLGERGNFLANDVVSWGEAALTDDKRLVAEAVSGKPEAFEELVRRHQDRLYNTLIHITGNLHEAEEVAQDAMLQAYKKLDSFRGDSSFYTWLYRIAFNLAASGRRKKRPRISLDQLQENASVDPTDSAGRPETQLERAERAQQLYDAMGRLGEEFRSVLVLRELEDCDYETISEMLDIPIGTVRSRLHRARTMLRDYLQHSIGEIGSA